MVGESGPSTVSTAAGDAHSQYQCACHSVSLYLCVVRVREGRPLFLSYPLPLTLSSIIRFGPGDKKQFATQSLHIMTEKIVEVGFFCLLVFFFVSDSTLDCGE